MLDLEPLIERDEEGIRRSIAAFRRDHTSVELFVDVSRFAVLSFAPSLHSSHALMACAAAWDVREEPESVWDAILTECAIYAAGSRQPWSEPPILDPPVVDGDHPGDIDELRAAVSGRDRLRGERWLAARLERGALRLPAEPELPGRPRPESEPHGTQTRSGRDDGSPEESPEDDIITVAADDVEDLGLKLMVAVAARDLAERLGEKGRYAVLRTAVWQLCATGSPAPAIGADEPAEAGAASRFPILDSQFERVASATDVLQQRLVMQALSSRGSIDAMHGILLYDAAARSGQLARVAASLAAFADERGENTELPAPPPHPPVYSLARDYATALLAYPVARRLGDPRIAAAALANLREGGTFEGWSFA